MRRSWVGGSDLAWRRLRAFVLDRDGYRCQLRLQGCTMRATTVHHTLGISVSGMHCDPAYLSSACFACNRRTGVPHGDPQPSARTAW